MWDKLLDAVMVFSDWLLVIGDPLLGWMLHLPRDLTLVLLAVMTGLIMTLIRRYTTNQDLLKRCKEDKARLKVLMAEAKRNGDRDNVKRIRTTTGQIAGQSFKAEGKPLLYSLLPIAILAIWAFSRISFMPPTPQDEIKVTMYFTEPQIGQLVSLLPEDGVAVHNGQVQQIGQSHGLDGEIDGGMAVWTIQAEERPEPYKLRFRHQGTILEAPFIVDGKSYAMTDVWYNDNDDVYMAEFKLESYKPFWKTIPDIDWVVPWWQLNLPIFIQAWLIGYLLLVIPLTFILKPVLKTY